MFTFDISLLQGLTFLVAVISPLLVGLVTTRVTAASTKAWLLAGISALTGFGSEAINAINSGEIYNIGTGLVTAGTAFIVAVSLHYGLYKNIGVSEKLQEVGSHTTK